MVKEIKKFSRKLLGEIEDLDMQGKSVNQIAKKLKITTEDVREGLNKIFEDELEK